MTEVRELIKEMGLIVTDVEELMKIVSECPTCKKRFKEYMQSKEQQQN